MREIRQSKMLRRRITLLRSGLHQLFEAHQPYLALRTALMHFPTWPNQPAVRPHRACDRRVHRLTPYKGHLSEFAGIREPPELPAPRNDPCVEARQHLRSSSIERLSFRG